MRLFSRLLIASGMLWAGGPVLAGPYDSTPLRGPLADEPHFQTSLGRDAHRFADAPINRYRLYDFYARQARYHLRRNPGPELLLPYPGLEGGRRGHWGGTNEKSSSAELGRTKEPRYLRLVERNESGDQHVLVTHRHGQSLCWFGNASPALGKVVLEVVVHTPEHPFSHRVDRFGFDLAFRGKDYLVGHGIEWHDDRGEAVPVGRDGHHLHQDSVIFRRRVDGAVLLDMPRVTYLGETAVFQRQIEWRGSPGPLRFRLPEAAAPLETPDVSIHRTEEAWLAVVGDGRRRLTHRVRRDGGAAGIALLHEAGKLWLSLDACRPGTTLQMDTWITTADGDLPPTAAMRPLSERLEHCPRYFDREVTVKGVRNADPAARGTAYEIDDIPVPVDHPYGTPMTASGLTFSASGDAFICTLVGDVWKVSGLNESLESVTWQRFASGLNSPLGLEMVEGVLHVATQRGILQLHDINDDGEADLVKPFTTVPFPLGRVHDLSRDEAGNFYFSHVSGIHRVSPDGAMIEKISEPTRNPLGLAVRSDGLALSDSSEGNLSNGTCSIFESRHPENERTPAKRRRILYLPRGIDNSPGSRIFMRSERFGPLGTSLLGLSYGTGRLYQILRDPNHGCPQAALRLLPGEFSSGSCRLATHPRDGQLYVVGLDGWGDFGVTEGCFHRVRYTGRPELVPVSWEARHDGLSVRFNEPIDPAAIAPDRIFVQQWNYTDSLHTYGSAEYSVKFPGTLGHDRIAVDEVGLSTDGREMWIRTPEILPAMCTQVYGTFTAASGRTLTLDLYATLNRLPAPDASPAGKPRTLEVPYRENNGNTSAVITGFFDKRAGRDAFQRPVGPAVPYRKEDLDYGWIREHLLVANGCLACHQAGTRHDFTHYDGLMKSVDLEHPGKSHLLGMLEAESMPPFPLPLVAPNTRQALREWIEMGAPQHETPPTGEERGQERPIQTR